MNLPIILPTRTSDDLNSAADINALMTDLEYIADELIDTIYPVGITIHQYPSDTGVFNSDEEPDTLFPGTTWEKQFDDEGTFFRTEGDPYGEEATSRTDGLQTSAFQYHGHKLGSMGSQKTGYTRSLTDLRSGTSSDITENPDNDGVDKGAMEHALDYVTDTIYDGGTPRVSKETRPINRQFRIWRRTA